MTAVTWEGKRRRQRAREVARREQRMKGRAEERHLSGGIGGGRGDNGGIEKRARERGGKIWLHLAWELAPLPVVHEEIETQKPPYHQKWQPRRSGSITVRPAWGRPGWQVSYRRAVGEMQFRASRRRVSSPRRHPHTPLPKIKEKNSEKWKDGRARHLRARRSLLYTLLPGEKIWCWRVKLFIGPFKKRPPPLCRRVMSPCRSVHSRRGVSGERSDLGGGDLTFKFCCFHLKKKKVMGVREA